MISSVTILHPCVCGHDQSVHSRQRGVCFVCYDDSDHGSRDYCNRYRRQARVRGNKMTDLTTYVHSIFAEFRNEPDVELLSASAAGRHARRLGMSERELSQWLQSAYGSAWVREMGLRPTVDLGDVRKVMMKAYGVEATVIRMRQNPEQLRRPCAGCGERHMASGHYCLRCQTKRHHTRKVESMPLATMQRSAKVRGWIVDPIGGGGWGVWDRDGCVLAWGDTEEGALRDAMRGLHGLEQTSIN